MRCLILFFIFISCSKYYKVEDLKLNYSQKSYLFGTYSFTTNFVYLPSRIGISLKIDNKILTYFAFNNDNGFFLIPLDGSKQEIFSINLFSQYTYEVFDSQLVNYYFEAKENTIYYIGKLIPNISFDVEYIYWGISEVVDNFEDDKLILKTNNNLETYNITNLTPKKFGKIKKLKYSPATPSNF
ncbi:MAG: hypothetical protein N2258_00185 [Brevinematales bacterium]|nr:hypothetical protein [Brevinematales bacterium]